MSPSAPADPVREFKHQWYLHSHPVRRGPKKNRVRSQQRKAAAMRLLASGRSYREVAEQLGYAGGNPGAVHRLVHRELARQVAASVELLRAVEVDRLNVLQDGLWDWAMAGDLSAIETVRRIVMERARVLGLLTSPTSAPRRDSPTTVVVDLPDARALDASEDYRVRTTSDVATL